MSDTFRRFLTGLVGAPLILAVLFWGGWALGAVLVVAAWIGQYEIYELLKRANLQPIRAIGYLLGGTLVLVPLLPGGWALPLVILLGLLGALPFYTKGEPLETLCATLVAAVYPPVLLQVLLQMRIVPVEAIGSWAAFQITASVVLLVWAADILAYVSGRLLGCCPLAPQLSPNKTWEGAVGGAAGALAVAAGLRVAGFFPLPWGHALVVALLIGGLSPVGDLLESRIKRSVQVKDTGRLLPGHGGIMDRIDALIFAVPVVFLYLQYIAKVW